MIKKLETIEIVEEFLMKNGYREKMQVAKNASENINEYLRQAIILVEHKDESGLAMMCSIIKENSCKGIEANLKAYISRKAKEYE